MLAQLWPVIAVAGIFGLIVAKNAVVYLWEESMELVADINNKEEDINDDRK